MKAEGFYKQRKVNTKELPPRLHAWYRTKMGFSLVVDLHTYNHFKHRGGRSPVLVQNADGVVSKLRIWL